MARRQHLTLMVVTAVVAFLFFSGWFMSSAPTSLHPASFPVPSKWEQQQQQPPISKAKTHDTKAAGSSPASHDRESLQTQVGVSEDILKGGSIAPKLENATLKAELGRASWKLFHTMMARFPEEPTQDDSLALDNYVRLFARLYPCGDCAAHFRKLLERYPPQTSSRNAAAGWACFVHNEVNKRLKKKEFDCLKIGDFYDCGCGDEDKKRKEAKEKTGEEEGRAGGDEDGKDGKAAGKDGAGTADAKVRDLKQRETE